jgi:hypothetical protein
MVVVCVQGINQHWLFTLVVPQENPKALFIPMLVLALRSVIYVLYRKRSSDSSAIYKRLTHILWVLLDQMVLPKEAHNQCPSLGCVWEGRCACCQRLGITLHQIGSSIAYLCIISSISPRDFCTVIMESTLAFEVFSKVKKVPSSLTA